MYLYIKRIFDIIFSLLAIIFLIPIFFPVVIILMLTGENKIFYKQKRIGEGNKEFGIYKFVTMIENSPNIGNGIYTAKNDPRILPFGKILRKTKINELPQIINIFLGDMSFVGPRPLIKQTYLFYNKNEQKLISSVKPGLTGVGSIVFRDEGTLLSKSKNNLENFYELNIAPNKAMLEIWYVNNRSFVIDFLMIALTAWVILFPKSNLIYSVFKSLPKCRF